MSRLHPKQVKGRYYVDNDACLFCTACVAEAPGHFAVDDLGYVFRQPATPEEEEDCQRAMLACPLGAVCDDGDGRREKAAWILPASLDNPEVPAIFEDYDSEPANWSQRITIAGAI